VEVTWTPQKVIFPKLVLFDRFSTPHVVC